MFIKFCIYCSVTVTFLSSTALCDSWCLRGDLKRASGPMTWWMWLSSIQPAIWTCCHASKTFRPGKTLVRKEQKSFHPLTMTRSTFFSGQSVFVKSCSWIVGCSLWWSLFGIEERFKKIEEKYFNTAWSKSHSQWLFSVSHPKWFEFRFTPFLSNKPHICCEIASTHIPIYSNSKNHFYHTCKHETLFLEVGENRHVWNIFFLICRRSSLGYMEWFPCVAWWCLVSMFSLCALPG